MKQLVCFLALLVVFYTVETAEYRVCVVHDDTGVCQQMIMDLAVTDYKFICVHGRDKIDCMRKIMNNEADLMNVAANEAYVAALNFTLVPIVQEERGGKTQGIMYESVVVVKRSSRIMSLKDLKTKRSCHTGYGRTAGWSIPVSILRAAPGVMDAECDELQSVSKFFSQSCVPGNWSTDSSLDGVLKSKNKNLCELCKSKCKGLDSEFIGYEGALRCLTETNADVAFTKLSVVEEFFRSVQNRNDYQFLCSNGSSVPLDSSNPCYWAARPNNVIVSRNSQQMQEMRQAILQTFVHFHVQSPLWLEKTLVSNSSITALSPEQDTIVDLLEKYNFRITIDQPLPDTCREKYVRFCVTSQAEQQKCHDFRVAAFAQRLRPQVECHFQNSTTECFAAINQGKADVVAVDSGEVLHGSKSYNLKPILSEEYGTKSVSYYAVAVVKTNSNITSLADLKGRKACHTGFRRTAGWNVPIGTLRKKGLILGSGCTIQNSVAQFFGSSCAPGAVGQESLCKLCVGNDQGEKKCSASSDERYYGYTGAFRCLVEGGGDIAFVKHMTVLDNTNGHNHDQWANRLSSSDYQLLCLDGLRKSVDDYEMCNWAQVTSHKVITTFKSSDATILDMKVMMTKAAVAFGPNKDLFKLFGKYNQTKDLLFKDTTTGLRSVSESLSVREVLGKELHDDLEATSCFEAISSASSAKGMAMTSILAFCIGVLFLRQRFFVPFY